MEGDITSGITGIITWTCWCYPGIESRLMTARGYGGKDMGIYVAIRKCGIKREQYVSVLENYRDESGQRRQRIIKNFGKLKDLERTDPDIIQKLKVQYEQSEKKETNQILSSISQNINNEDLENFEELAKEIGGSPLYNGELNYGILAVRPIWNDWLGLNYKLSLLQKNETNLKSDISEIARYLVSLKLIDPHSYFCGYNSQYKFLNNPIHDCSVNDIYNTVEFIGENRNAIMEYLNRRIVQNFNRKLTMVYYDCSNLYFETPYDDKQKLFSAMMSAIKKQFKEENKELSDKELIEMSQNPELINKAIQELASLANEDTFWRMRGLSKEHRYDLPLVSVALAVDDRGIPVDFDVFPGNFSEFKTMPKVIGNMKKKYNIKDTVVVADRGLNSVANIEMLVDHGLGFIVAQKVSNLKPKYEEAMYDHTTGYRLWSPKAEPPKNGQGVPCTKKLDLEDNEFVYKRIPYVKEGMSLDEQGERHKAKIDCEILFTFSRKRYKRDIAKLEEDLAKAKDAVNRQLDMTPCGGAGWKGLVSIRKETEENIESQKSQTENKINNDPNSSAESNDADKSENQQSETAQNPDTTNTRKDNKVANRQGSSKKHTKPNELYKAESIKEDVVNERRKRAGYVAIILKPAGEDKNKNDGQSSDQSESISSSTLTDYELLTSHKRLLKIEECFRIMKSNFSVRPVYVRKKINICGHITLCVIALIIMRLLEIKLEEAGTPLTVNQIQEALNSTVTAVSKNGKSGLFMKNNSVHNFINIKEWKKLSPEQKREAKDNFVKRFLESKEYLPDIDKILDVVGLEPLDGLNAPSTLCRKLKIRSNYMTMVGDLVAAIQQATSATQEPMPA